MINVYAFKFNSLCQNLTFLIIFVHFLVNLFVLFLHQSDKFSHIERIFA